MKEIQVDLHHTLMDIINQNTCVNEFYAAALETLKHNIRNKPLRPIRIEKKQSSIITV